MSGEAAVQVAVRVRPYNGREKAMGAKRCIEMEDQSTFVYEEDIEDTDLEPRTFNFDFSLWSHYDFDAEPGGENPDHPGRLNVNQDVRVSFTSFKATIPRSRHTRRHAHEHRSVTT